MGKKKGQQGGKHAQQTFADMVGRANQEALKPYILSVFGELANDLSKRMFTRMGILQNRIQAMENVLKDRLNLTDTDLETYLFNLEDEVTGYRQVDRPAQEGDLLRLQMRIKNSNTGYGKVTKREFANLGRPPFAMGVPFIEKALIGVSTGETKVVPFDEALVKETSTEEIEFVVDRISERIEKPEEKKQESQNADSPNAPEPTGSPETSEANPPVNGRPLCSD